MEATLPKDAHERRRGFSLRQQLRVLTPVLLLWLIGLCVLLIARVQTVAPLEHLFLDPTSITGSPWYTGALSNLGILVWSAGAVFAVCGAWIAQFTGRRQAASFLAVGAAVTLVLVIDDVFNLHSGPLKQALGVSKTTAQLVIVLPAIVWLVAYLPDIRRTRVALIVAALASLAGSVVVDTLFSGFSGFSGFWGTSSETVLFIEDGMKFLGILAWSQYFAITSKDIAASAIGRQTGVETTTLPESVDEPDDNPVDQRDGGSDVYQAAA